MCGVCNYTAVINLYIADALQNFLGGKMDNLPKGEIHIHHKCISSLKSTKKFI